MNVHDPDDRAQNSSAQDIGKADAREADVTERPLGETPSAHEEAPAQHALADATCSRQEGQDAAGPHGAEEAPASSPARPKHRRRLAAAAATCGAFALVLLAAGIFLANDWLDPAAREGRYEGWDEQAVRDDLDRQVKEGMMAVSISSSIAFDDGRAEGEARIENVPGNRVDQKIVITLDDTGEVLYESKALEPGTHVQRIRLSRDLDPGSYAATAVFTGYDRETHAQRGSAGVQVMLHVLN